LRNGLRRFPQGFSCPAVLRCPLRVQIAFAYVAITLYGPSFQRASANDWIGNSTVADPTTPAAPNKKSAHWLIDSSAHLFFVFQITRLPNHPIPRSFIRCNRFGLFRFRSPLLSESRLLSFPPGTEMVHFPGFARARLWIRRAVRRFYHRGFPHSEIPGSKPACGSPRLIAACHVLLRLLLPRHPPCALSSLTIKFTQRTRACARSL
jgi:hypothetical protein